MPDNENGQLPVEETTQPMPSENKPESEDSLPDEASDRTKEQFEKLKETNRELAKKLEILEKVAQPQEPKLSALERLRGPSTPKVQDQPQPTSVAEEDDELVDENGYIDEARLKSGLTKSQLKAKEAEEKALKAQQQAEEALRRVEEYETTNEKKRVHSSFPEVDPYSDKFVPELYDQVSKEMLWNLVNVGTEDFFGTTEKVVSQYRQKNQSLQTAAEQQQAENERVKQEVQEPSRTGQVAATRREQLMREIQRPKQAGLDALTELMRDH